MTLIKMGVSVIKQQHVTFQDEHFYVQFGLSHPKETMF